MYMLNMCFPYTCFTYFCLLFIWGFSSHSRIFTHMEMSPLSVKDCKTMLGTQGHWAVRIPKRATHTLTRVIRLYWSSRRTCDTHTFCRALSSGAGTTCFHDLVLSRLGFKHPTVSILDERSDRLSHPRGLLHI